MVDGDGDHGQLALATLAELKIRLTFSSQFQIECYKKCRAASLYRLETVWTLLMAGWKSDQNGSIYGFVSNSKSEMVQSKVAFVFPMKFYMIYSKTTNP